MKNKGIILIALFAIVLAFGSCKKGVNDPSFSFKSRDARITADWVLSSMNKSRVEVTTAGQETLYTSTTTYVFDGTDMTETSNNGIGDDIESYSYSYEIVINDDGTYNETETNDGEKFEKTDYWFWANSDKTKIAVTFSGNGTYMIDRLAKDELVLTQSTVTSETDSDGYVTTVNNDLIMSFTKK
ncbi:MAG: hypothetical protein DRI94_13250 [Bacteroidetes bacterium]|nr:MAG: hypothetical protein DRI94_13250 [Bacteroidota bacterium]